MSDLLSILLSSLSNTIATYHNELEQRLQQSALTFKIKIDKLVVGHQTNSNSAAKTSRVLEALRQLRAGNEQYFASPFKLRYLCWGLLEQDPKLAPIILLEDARWFPNFLNLLRQAHLRGSLTQQHLRGLVHAYFHYSLAQSEAGSQQWADLRAFLAQVLRTIFERTNRRPNWLVFLADHPGVFTTEPAKDFVAMVNRNPEYCNEIKTTLGLAETSWLLNELIYLPVKSGCALQDVEFKARITGLLAYLQQHEIILDRGLAEVLSRYSRCNDHSSHSQLQGFSCTRWGLPHYSQKLQWGRVDETVRTMVQQWIVLEDLEDFFTLLQEEKIGDQRRLAFWKQWIDKISYSFIYLGPHCYWNSHEDFLKLKKRKSGRIGQLMHSGTRENNAILMRYHDYAIIEFSEPGNACFVYLWDELPFNAKQSRVQLDELKQRTKSIHRLRHTVGWEIEFQKVLKMLSPLRTDAAYPSGRMTEYSDKEIFQYCHDQNIEYEDHRTEGGYLWVYHCTVDYGKDANPTIAYQLRMFGFKHKPGKGWWKS